MNYRTFINAILKIVLTVTLVATAGPRSAAQDYITSPVTISKEKVRVNGNVCYSHIVREKQTLYSISKAYEVSVEDIYKFNPSLMETGLKKNAIILIPSKETLAKLAEAKEVSAEPVVQAKETVIESKETVIEDRKEERKEEEEKKVEEKKVEEKKHKVHIVKWYEDLDVIADKYGVTVDAIVQLNNLSGRKLSKRQKLLIPEPGEIIETTPITQPEPETAESPEAEEQVTETDTTSVAAAEEKPEWIFRPKDEVKVTLILPMKASSTNPSKNNLDFYSGVLMAVKDMSDKGINTELNVYDSSDSNNPIASEDLGDSDLVIGPVTSTDLTRILSNVPAPKFLISPLDPKAEAIADSCSRFLHAPTPHKTQYEDLLTWISEDQNQGDSLIIISEKGARQTEALMQMNSVIDSSDLGFKRFSYSILEGRDVIDPMKSLMTDTDTNRVLIVSESEAFVNDVVRNLNILIYQKKNIVLYAPARIRGFETIEVEHFHNTSMHLSLGYNINYDNPQIKDFLLKYRALFNTEPSQFAYQGYDIATYFITMCSRYGDRWYKKLETHPQEMLQSRFEFRKKEDGGFVNKGVRRIVYGKDWTIRQD